MSRMRLCPSPRISALAAFFLLVSLSVVAAPGAVAGTTGPAVSPSANPTAYVGLDDPNNGCAGMVPINTATNTAEAGEIVGPTPCGNDTDEAYALAVSPNGGTVYAVTALGNGGSADGDVVPVSTTTGVSGSEIKVGLVSWVPTAIAITPNGNEAFVADSGDSVYPAPGAINTVTPVNLVTGTAGSAITVGDNPDGIAITPDGSTAYVTNSGGDTVTPINVSTDAPGPAITVGSTPDAIAIAPNGSTAYVANGGSSTVTPINLASGKPGSPIPVGGDPDAIAITPNGTTVYVANFNDGTVTPISTATDTAGTAIALPDGTLGLGPASPTAIAVSPNGSAAYVASWNTNVVVPISTATNTAETAINLGSFGPGQPFSITFAPGWQGQAAVRSSSTGPAPSLCWFDGALYAAFTTSGGGISWAVNSGSGWSAAEPVGVTWGPPDTSWSPALVDYNGLLQLYWTNAVNNAIKYSTFSDGSWSAPATVSGTWGTAESNAGPAVGSDGALLAVGWKGQNDNELWYTVTNGSGWSAQVNTGQATSYPPAIAALPSSGVPLAFAWTEPSGSIGYGALTILSFEPEGTVPQAATNVSPALAFAGNVSSDGTLYVAWKGLTNDKIGYESIYNVAENGLSASNWTSQEFEPQAQTLEKPSLTVSGYNLYAGWTDESTDDLFYASAENPY